MMYQPYPFWIYPLPSLKEMIYLGFDDLARRIYFSFPDQSPNRRFLYRVYKDTAQ